MISRSQGLSVLTCCCTRLALAALAGERHVRRQ